jgi:DNA polymerase III subunit beta
MEFTIEREVFLAGIQRTLGIIERKATMPIMGNLLIRACGERITIVATDREIGFVGYYPASVIDEGEITLSARKLFEIVRELSGETVHLGDIEANSTAKIGVTLTSDKAVCTLFGIPSDDYPSVLSEEDLPFFPIKAVVLKELIRKVSFAAANDEQRPVISGVFLEKEIVDDVALIRMVATDGHRLALAAMKTEGKEISIPGGPEAKSRPGIVIPRKGLGEMNKMIEAEEGDVLMGSRPGVLVVKNDSVLLRISLIDGEYPDYRHAIPGGESCKVKIDRNAILHSLRRMKIINMERVVLTFSGHLLALHSMHPDWGEIRDEIEISPSGEEKKASFQVKYLLDAIEVVDEPTIDFELGEGLKHSIVRGTGNGNYFCIVMPLKL